MEITFFSIIMAILCFNVGIVLLHWIQRKEDFIPKFSTFPLAFLTILAIFRLLFQMEFFQSYVISSKVIYPAIYNFFQKEISIFQSPFTIMECFAFLWIVLASVFLIFMAWKYFHFRKILLRIRDFSRPIDQEIAQKILQEAKLDKKLNLVINHNIERPFLFGIRKGTIFLPKRQYSERELRCIVKHEISHYQRKDNGKKLFLEILRGVFWWDPFVHLMAENFNHILEVQCDLLSIRNFSKEEKIDYLETILKMIKEESLQKEGELQLQWEALSNFVPISQGKNIKDRIRTVIEYTGEKTRHQKIANALACSLGLCFFVLSYMFIPQPSYDVDAYGASLGETYYTAEEVGVEEETVYITRNPKGKLRLVVDGQDRKRLKEEDLQKEEYKGLNVYDIYE